MAEVINIEDGTYMSYDFEGWREISELRIALEDLEDNDDWIAAVNFSIQVPRVIRLLYYDRVPKAPSNSAVETFFCGMEIAANIVRRASILIT